jgi:hypothetical protein
MESGQVLVVVAFSIVVLIAIVGLAMDVGVMFIENARLRRAVDAAALAAALQFREGYLMSELDSSATEFLRLNGINDPGAIVQICGGPGNHNGQDLCTIPARKLVRVIARGTVHLAFLPVVGIDNAPISAQAVSETASVDVVLLIDISESMSFDGSIKDPHECNQGTSSDGYLGSCKPLDDVKRAAVAFVQQLYFPYDQVSVITFDKDATRVLPLSSNEGVIITAIKGLQVYEGDESVANPVCPIGSPCRLYNPETGAYMTFGCQSWDVSADPTPCTTTNIGGGLLAAGNLLGSNPRKAALWVTILLTDGTPNSGVCPESTWSAPPFCRRNPVPYVYSRLPSSNLNYDALDYAHDMADFVALGQHSLIFAIGLGSQAASPAATELLTYVVSEDVGRGLFYQAPTPDQLRGIFMKIANNIATRLAK